MTPDEIPERDWFAINEDGCGFIKDAKLEPQVTLKDTVTLLRQEIDRLQKQNEIMKQALEYYSLMTTVCRHDDSSWCDHCPDGGKRARQALKDCEEL